MKIRNLLLALFLVIGFTANSQTNGSFKSVRFYNVPDSAEFLSTTWANFIARYPDSGGIYYNEQSNKFRVYQNGAWGDLGGGSGSGSVKFASNGLSLDLDTAILGGNPLNRNTTVGSNGLYSLNLGGIGNPLSSFGSYVTVNPLRESFLIVDDDLTELGVLNTGNTHSINLASTTGVTITSNQGVTFVPQSTDPATSANGKFWYNSTLNQFRGRKNSVSYDIVTALNSYANGEITYWSGGSSLASAAGFTYNSGIVTVPRLVPTPSATTPGISFGTYAGDPSTPSNGDVWYNTVANFFRGRQNGSNITFGDMLLSGTQTVSGPKTFLTNNLLLRNPANTFSYTINGAAIVANRTLNLPLIGGTETLISSGSSMTTNYIPYGAGNNSVNVSSNFTYNGSIFQVTNGANNVQNTGTNIHVNNSGVGSTYGAQSMIVNNGTDITSAGGGATSDIYITANSAADIAFRANGGTEVMTITGAAGQYKIGVEDANVSGTAGPLGIATLVAGTVTVNNASVTTSSRIFLTVYTAGGTQGFLSVGTRTAGTSFVINSTSATDTSTVAYFIVTPQ